jgi:hypothetical protein
MYAAYDRLAQAQPQAERRRGGRIAHPAITCELGQIEDVSISGILIRLGFFKRLKPGQRVDLALRGHNAAITCAARAVRHISRQVALELLDLDDNARALLARLAGIRAESGEGHRRPRMD